MGAVDRGSFCEGMATVTAELLRLGAVSLTFLALHVGLLTTVSVQSSGADIVMEMRVGVNEQIQRGHVCSGGFAFDRKQTLCRLE